MQHAIAVFVISLLFLQCLYVSGKFSDDFFYGQKAVDADRRVVIVQAGNICAFQDKRKTSLTLL